MEQLIAYAHEPPSALPSPASFARPATRDMQIYDDHDVEELLLGYVAPRTDMVDALGADEEEMDAQIMERAARRMYGEYVQVREHVWPMPTAREHSTGPQHLAVTSMWLNTLRLQRYAEYARTEMDSDHLAQSEFAFITHLGVAAGRAGLVLSDVPLGSFSMAQLTVAIEETCRVLCETGAGTADPDAVLVYWRALWARYVSLMEPGGVEEEEEEEDAMDLDTPEGPPPSPTSTQSILLALLETAGRQEAHVARPLTAVARPALGVAKATPPSLFDRPQYLEPLAADSGDVREGKLPLPLPLTQGASRVQVHYLFVMELRYHAFESLLQTWAAYRRAAVLPRHAPLRRVFDTLIHLLHTPDRPASGAVAALVMELHLESEESLVNVGAQNHLWTELFKAYMYPGDAEYYVLRQMEKGSFFQRSLADAPFVAPWSRISVRPTTSPLPSCRRAQIPLCLGTRPQTFTNALPWNGWAMRAWCRRSAKPRRSSASPSSSSPTTSTGSWRRRAAQRISCCSATCTWRSWRMICLGGRRFSRPTPTPATQVWSA